MSDTKVGVEVENGGWFCDHCGIYFSEDANTCPCGAVVDEYVGFAFMADKHRWTPPGAKVCVTCQPVQP